MRNISCIYPISFQPSTNILPTKTIPHATNLLHTFLTFQILNRLRDDRVHAFDPGHRVVDIRLQIEPLWRRERDFRPIEKIRDNGEVTCGCEGVGDEARVGKGVAVDIG
jgi:hypothetical protein